MEDCVRVQRPPPSLAGVPLATRVRDAKATCVPLLRVTTAASAERSTPQTGHAIVCPALLARPVTWHRPAIPPRAKMAAAATRPPRAGSTGG